MVDRKFVEAADALRFEMVNAHDGSFAPFVDRSLKDKIEAYDTARSRLAAAQPAEHPESIGGLASRTPASKQGKKALDDMLLVFAKHDDDEEDCWTQPARRGVQYVSDLEWDLETQVRLASHRAEANESLRIMLSNLAAYTGTHFGPDEPLKNYERVRKTLTDKPEPPAPSPQAQGEVCEGCGVEPARTYSADDVHLCVKCARENVDGSSLPAPEESAPAQDGEPTLEDCQRAAIEATRKLHPNASDLALLLSPDEAAQVAAVRALCLSRARDASWRIEVRGSQPQCWVVVDPSGDCGEQSFTVGPGFDEDEREDAEHFARMTSTALERLASRAYSEPTVKSCLTEYAHALTKADVPGSIPSERHRAGIEAVLAHCLNRAPDAEYLRKYAEAVLASRAPSPSPALSAISFEEVERAYDDAKESDGRSWSREAGLRAVMALYAKPAPALAAQLIEAAKRIDWVQIGLNGDGCFHLEDGRFCLRGHRWPGHGGRNPVHLYEPLYVAMTRIAKASDAAPALASVDVEAASRAIDNAILLASVYDGVAIDKDKVMADLAALRRALTRADEKDERASGKEPAP